MTQHGAGEAVSYSWKDLVPDHPMELLDRRRIMGENVTVAHVTLHEGLFVPIHHHENEQLAVVLSGRVEFEVGNEAERKNITLSGGDVLHLPSNVPHSARAIERSVVIDVFSPAAAETGVDGTRDG